MAQKKAVLIYSAEEAWNPAETNRLTPFTVTSPVWKWWTASVDLYTVQAKCIGV
jgi:hypothetical protein